MSNPADSLEEVLDRVAGVAGARSDADIARALAVTAQTVANWRRRNSIPYQCLCNFADKHGLSLDYVILGREPKHRRRTEVDAALLAKIGGIIEGSRLVMDAETYLDLTFQQRYFYIALVYNRLLRLPDEMRQTAVVDEIEFLITALKTAGGDLLELEKEMASPGAKRVARRKK